MADLRKHVREKIGAAIRAASDVPEVLTVGAMEKMKLTQSAQNEAMIAIWQWIDAIELN